jgi:hypothetical protein
VECASLTSYPLFLRPILAGVFLSLFSLFATAGGNAKDDQLMTIKLLSLSANSIAFLAVSHGCSKPEDFMLQIEGNELSVFRAKKDFCRKMPQWRRFELPLDYSDQYEALLVMNPLSIKKNPLK